MQALVVVGTAGRLPAAGTVRLLAVGLSPAALQDKAAWLVLTAVNGLVSLPAKPVDSGLV